MELDNIQLFSSSSACPEDVEIGELLFGVSVVSVNIVKDLRENIRNLQGGVMKNYESLLDKAIERAITNLKNNAHEKGYSGVVGLQMAHPTIVEGCAEIVFFGNGYTCKSKEKV